MQITKLIEGAPSSLTALFAIMNLHRFEVNQVFVGFVQCSIAGQIQRAESGQSGGVLSA